MNKYLIVVLVVAVLALTGCNKEKKLLADCYASSEAFVKSLCPYNDLSKCNSENPFFNSDHQEKYGVSAEGFITQAGRDRCKRLVEIGWKPIKP